MPKSALPRPVSVLRRHVILMVGAALTLAAGAMVATAAPADTGVTPEVVSTAPSDGPTVTRWGGPDRYEVAVGISEANFEAGVGTVYLANGLASADALAAGPVAGMERSPILLTRKDTVPDSVMAELARLDPAQVVLLGGTGSVSTTVESRVGQFAPTARFGGVDRYEVAVNISRAKFPSGAETVYVANGLASADALSAGPVAGKSTSPILLTRKDAIPPAVVAELNRLSPSSIVILGGTGSVSAEVGSALGKIAPTTRFGGADRYEVSANIAKANFTTTGGTVFVANGLASADALAAGPVGATAPGPILLLRTNLIPATVQAQLNRLQPSKVVILGGAGSVNEIVELALGPDPLPAGVVNTLLIGTDSRESGSWEGNADSIILVHIPGDRSKVYLISFPRDLYVAIPGNGCATCYDPGKINAAFAYGGVDMLTATISHTLGGGVTTNYALQSNFESFIAMTRWLDGYQVDNKHYSKVTVESTGRVVTFPVGTILLENTDGLIYVRDRATLPNSDLDRAERQRASLIGMMDRMKDRLKESPSALLTLVQNLYGTVKITGDFTLEDARGLTPLMNELSRADVVSMQAPISGSGTITYRPEVGPEYVHFVDWDQAAALGTALKTDTMAQYVTTHGTDYLP